MDRHLNDEFKFLVTNSQAGWAKGLWVNLEELPDGGIKLKETLEYMLDKTVSLKGVYGLNNIEDVTVDECGTLYLLDHYIEGNEHKYQVYTFDVNTRVLDIFNYLEGITENFNNRPFTMAVSTKNLFIGDKSNKSLKAFALVNHQMRWMVKDVVINVNGKRVLENFSPDMILCDNSEHLFVLDKGNKKVVRFNPGGLAEEVYQIIVYNEECFKEEDYCFAIDRKSLMPYVLYKATTDKEVKTLVLGSNKDKSLISEPLITFDKSIMDYTSVKPVGIYAGDDGEIYICVEATDLHGVTMPLLKFNKDGEFLERTVSFSSTPYNVFIHKGGCILAYLKDLQEMLIYSTYNSIEGQGETSLSKGCYYSTGFDKGDTKDSWHRLVLDADIPENTQIKVYYYTGNENEIDPIIRSELLQQQYKVERLEKIIIWKELLSNPPDALLDGSSDRYLWLKIELVGWKQKSPHLRGVKVYYPRMSYLRYLPSIYSEDKDSREFLEKFLSLFESMYYDMEYKIEHVARYLDVDSAPSEYLSWLARWLAISADDNWEADKLKLFIKSAPLLYKKYGTRDGILKIIELFTGEEPFIFEYFEIENINEDSWEGQGDGRKELLYKLYAKDRYSYCVLLKPTQVRDDKEFEMVRSLVESSSPAHTNLEMVHLKPMVILNGHSYLGLNSFLYKPEFILNQGKITQIDSVLGDNEDSGQILKHSRVGEDTVLT